MRTGIFFAYTITFLITTLALRVYNYASGYLASTPREVKRDDRSDMATNKGFALSRRSYFYVGGQYEEASLHNLSSSGLIRRGQIYVESLEPLHRTQKYPLVMIAGNGQTGTNFLNTPDSRPGWADHFLHAGYHVYIIDQPARGRSPYLPTLSAHQTLTLTSTSTYTDYWTAIQHANLWPQARLYTQWPGTTGAPGDPVFDALYASGVQALSNQSYVEELMRSVGRELMERIGPAVVLTHSQAGALGWVLADVLGEVGLRLVKGILAVEPLGPPFVDEIRVTERGVVRPYGLTTTKLAYDPPISSAAELKTITVPPPAGSNGMLTKCIQQDPDQPGGSRRLPHLQGFPVLVVTSEAGYHAQYDYCTVKYLRDAGVDVTWFELPKVGIHGNSHFMFLERNSDEIAGRIEEWLRHSVA